MKRLMKKTSSTLSILEDMVDRNELPSEDKIKESIMNDSEKTPKILELVNQIYGDISPEIQMVAVQNMPWSVRVIENPTEEVQQYILEYAEKNRRSDLIHIINNPNKDVMEKKMRPHARHDAHNRDWAWAYIDGEIYRAHNHPECFEKYRRQKENQEFEVGHRKQIKDYVEKNETKTPIACGALVYEGVYDYTGEKNAIYIDPVTIFNVTIEEVVQKLKEEFPDYKIFNDDEFEIDVDNNKIKYTRLAKLKKFEINTKRLIKKSISLSEIAEKSNNSMDFYLNVSSDEGLKLQLIDQLKKYDGTINEKLDALYLELQGGSNVSEYMVENEKNINDFELNEPEISKRDIKIEWRKDESNTLASAFGSIVRVHPELMKYDANTQHHVIAHEVGHILSNAHPELEKHILDNPQGALGKVNLKKEIFEGVGHTPEESWAEAFAHYFVDKEWLRSNYPKAFNFVEVVIDKMPYMEEYLTEAISQFEKLKSGE